MLSGKIEFKDCKTLGDVELAIEEATGRILNGFTSGMDSNEDGSFTFEVDGDEEEISADDD